MFEPAWQHTALHSMPQRVSCVALPGSPYPPPLPPLPTLTRTHARAHPHPSPTQWNCALVRCTCLFVVCGCRRGGGPTVRDRCLASDLGPVPAEVVRPGAGGLCLPSVHGICRARGTLKQGVCACALAMLTGPTEHAAPWPLARSNIRERAQAEWRAHPRFANDVSCWLPFRPVCVFSSSMQTPPPPHGRSGRASRTCLAP